MNNDIVSEVLRDLGIDNPMEEVVIASNGSIITVPTPTTIDALEDIVESAVENMNPTYTDYEEITEEITPTEELVTSLQSARESFEEALNDEMPIIPVGTVEETEETEESSVNPNLLPVNSSTYTINDTTLRFSGASWFEEVQSKSVIIGGMGGISSWVAMILSRLRPQQIFAYDDDVVETVNLAGQFFMTDSVNTRKVDAIAKLAKSFSDYYAIMAIPDRFTKDTAGGNIMICGFDNMEARKIFFTVWKNHIENLNESNRSHCLYIDGRLDMSSMQIFCMTGNDTYNINRYEKEFLFTDAEADETVCSMKQTTYCASMIGSLVCNLYTNFCANLVGGMYDLPFFTYYDANCMYFKTEA